MSCFILPKSTWLKFNCTSGQDGTVNKYDPKVKPGSMSLVYVILVNVLYSNYMYMPQVRVLSCLSPNEEK